ncbi:hypothetical protein Desdi_2660 [Desulfitobacterium dichloroeliminans LMG P-21439]|uniref:Uncharacterized protein n=1 Tax=Desulfitobacterium dichloroeliminans (strain LMG P-21439 / DCA1) TaxID=871963 RepID=L0FBR4_DESDL|nr:hypothetical protein [Desulfitobacterium dichloroeliminans]AGA70076.1 hypothetical protein Desdi_2660 [Desulfitobacterium dichloroeliminans LMG P-21439]
MNMEKHIKRLLCLGLILVIVSTTAGCTRQTAENSGSQIVPTDNLPIGSEVTDPELERLWQEYIYDAIYTIGNTWEFHSAEEIDPAAVARFCWQKYQEENGTDKLQKVSEEDLSLLFPLADAQKYAERYFNLTALDVSKITDYYKPEKQAFVFSPHIEKCKPRHTTANAWGTKLDKVMKTNDGTLTVAIEYYSDSRVDSRQTFSLKERADGSFYFVDGRREFIDNHLVTLTGNVKEFREIEGFSGDLQEISMVGEAEGKLLLVYTPYNESQSGALMLLNPNEMRIEKSVSLSSRIESTDVRFTDNRLIVRSKDKVLVYSRDLEVQSEISLPNVITEKMVREQKYDQMGLTDVFFGGYDISSDLCQIVYTDEIGVKLVTLQDGKEKLLAKTIAPKVSEPSRGAPITPSYHFSPRFVADDKKVITTLSAYEWTAGFTLCDLDKGTNTKYEIITEGSLATGGIRYDTGLLFVNQYWYDERGAEKNRNTDGYITTFLDFHSGQVSEIELSEPGDTGYIRFDDQSYIGQNYAAFATSKRSDGGRANDRHYLNRINLQTLRLEQEIVSIAATDIHILGVLEDGRIIFWYQYNPAEKGIGLTAER